LIYNCHIDYKNTIYRDKNILETQYKKDKQKTEKKRILLHAQSTGLGGKKDVTIIGDQE